MNYWEMRKAVSKMVPRMGALEAMEMAKEGLIKEKGRKSNYHQFSLITGQFEKQERLLNTEEMNSFLEVSLRAMGCPMCLNLDVWDGLYCIAEGQKVLTPEGLKNIESVHPGSKVFAFDESSQKVVIAEVSQSVESQRDDIVEIETADGILICTSDHPIYTQRGWVEAGKLADSDKILKIKPRPLG